MLWDVEHPWFGKIKEVTSPVKMASIPDSEPLHAPLLGEHTDEVLTGLLHYSPDQIAQLRSDGVVRGLHRRAAEDRRVSQRKSRFRFRFRLDHIGFALYLREQKEQKAPRVSAALCGSAVQPPAQVDLDIRCSESEDRTWQLTTIR